MGFIIHLCGHHVGLLFHDAQQHIILRKAREQSWKLYNPIEGSTDNANKMNADESMDMFRTELHRLFLVGLSVCQGLMVPKLL